MTLFSRKYLFSALYVALAGYFLVIFAPVLIFGVKGGYDVLHHMSWYLSFRDEISLNNLYPRWLTTQYNGLGAPALYFYPPFTTYFYYLIDSLTFFYLSPDHLLALSGFILCFISGGGFYLWARIHVPPSWAILFSALYMAVPYHLLMNFYWRAAMAEFAAYIWVPLIFAATYHIVVSPQVRWILALSLAVAGLFLSHLLSALIVGPMVAIYAFSLVQKEHGIITKQGFKSTLSIAFYALLGIGMAAIYFLPALTLMDHISTEALYRKNIEDSYLYKVLFVELNNHGSRQRTAFFAFIYLVISLYLLFEILCARGKSVTEMIHRPLYWIGVVIVGFTLMCGFFGFLFQDPSPYKNIQFLSRLLLIVEFAAITAVMAWIGNTLSQPTRCKRCTLIVGGLFSILILFQLYDVAGQSRGLMHKAGPSEWNQVQQRMGPDEYFPAGFDYTVDPHGESFIAKQTASNNLAIITKGKGEILSASQDGPMFTIKVSAQTPVMVQLKQFYFPGWVAHDSHSNMIEINRSSNYMVSIALASGSHEIKISRALLGIEKTGLIVSLLSFVCLCVLSFINKNRSCRQIA